MNPWTKFDTLLNAMGAEQLLDALSRALSTDELNENCDYIAKCHGINLPDEEDE